MKAEHRHRCDRHALARAAAAPAGRWLAAEARGADADAERALAELFQHLPAAAPSPGFADGVLVRAGVAVRPAVVATAPRLAGALGSWPARALWVVCMVLAALGLAWAPALALALGRVVGPSELVTTWAAALAAAAEHLPAALALARLVGSVAAALARAASSPPVLVAGLLALASATLAWRWLAQLLSPQRSLAHDPTP